MQGDNAKKYQTIVLTGATGGVGKILDAKLVNVCKKLIIIGRNKNKLKDTASYLKGIDAKLICETIEADLSSEIGIKETILILNKKDKINVLINCAAKFTIKSIADSTFNDLLEDFNLNTFAPFMLAKECSKGMIEAGHGVILNVGSSSAYGAAPNTSIYCATKHALLGVSRAFQMELRSKGIRTTYVAPGSIQTEMGEQLLTQDYSTFIEPEELAEFLVSIILQEKNMIINEVSINRMIYK